MNRLPRLLAFGAFLLALQLPATSRAVDNSARILGLGTVQQFAGGGRPAQLSVKFAPQPRLELGVLFGMALGTNPTFTPGLRGLFVLLPEEHLNLYAVGAVSADLRGTGGLTAVVYQVGPGIEFFVPSWPHVGFSLEFGLGGEVLTAGDSPGFLATTGTGFGAAGIHYWF
jgi:hypothetical protein